MEDELQGVGVYKHRDDQTKIVVLHVTFLASGDFCCLLLTFANSLDPDQD